jgi:catechol-2,3-dioxygenase
MEDYADKPQQACVGHVHTAFAYDRLADLLGTFQRLRAQGILPVRSINHGPTVSLYYADPDGNQVELQVDSFPNAEATNAWMRSDAFRRNPIGIPFDPDQMFAQLQAGAAEVELMRRPDTV